jgi:urea transporter
MQKLLISRTNLDYYLKSIFNSYSQVFFSDHRAYAILLMAISFFDPYAGLAGFLAVLTTSLIAFLLNLDKTATSKGLYGFNGLLTGLGLGVYYLFSGHLVFIIILAAMFSLFVSLALQGVLGKYNLPFLSFPFLITIWIFFIASSNFTTLGINERGIYTLNEYYAMGGMPLVSMYETITAFDIPDIIYAFLVSLSAIFFQYNVVAGIIIALGLLIFSRIGFSLACLGFTVAYGFYMILGVEINSYDYSYIGFNYILTSIAIGGFFLVPSTRSYISVVVLIPLVAIITLSFSSILHTFRLPVYSLPFSLITLLYLYVLKFRINPSTTLSEVTFQFNSPEKNLYSYQNKLDRFRFHHLVTVKLPFYGAWNVSQGHNGEHTHQNQWQHAWDFVILDKNNKQYKDSGNYPEDYYCYNKPVLAPADGVVEKVVDDIDDNIIGQVNLKSNWGNTVIIKHQNNVYSNISHLRNNSVEVKEGQKVLGGQIIGRCGNSGRSPYPHLHFQIQAYPYIGAATIDYPIANFVKLSKEKTEILSFERPLKNDVVSNIKINSLLNNAFQFIPGQILTFNVSGLTKIKEISWEVKVNHYNQSYLHCKQSNSYAYFENQDSLFYFTQYYGKRGGLLYDFMQGVFKIQKGFYKDLNIIDNYPLYLFFPRRYLWIQDFISPFKIFVKSIFKLTYTHFHDSFESSEITIHSSAKNSFLNKNISSKEFDLKITSSGISSIIIHGSKKPIILERCENI